MKDVDIVSRLSGYAYVDVRKDVPSSSNTEKLWISEQIISFKVTKDTEV